MSKDAATMSIRFGAITDAHYAPRVYGNRFCRDSLVKARAAVEQFNRLGLDLAVNLGDVVDTAGSARGDAVCVADMRDVLTGFNGHWIHVLGNHDVETLSKEQFRCELGLDPGHWFGVTDYGAFRFIILDGNCHENGTDFCAGNFSWDTAWVATAQIDFLREALTETDDRPVVLLCHENIDSHMCADTVDPHVIRNAADVRAVIEHANNIKVVLHGHYHPGRTSVQNDVSYVTLTSMVEGAGQENNAFAVVTIAVDGTVTVDGFGRQQKVTIPGDEQQ